MDILEPNTGLNTLPPPVGGSSEPHLAAAPSTFSHDFDGALRQNPPVDASSSSNDRLVQVAISFATPARPLGFQGLSPSAAGDTDEVAPASLDGESEADTDGSSPPDMSPPSIVPLQLLMGLMESLTVRASHEPISFTGAMPASAAIGAENRPSWSPRGLSSALAALQKPDPTRLSRSDAEAENGDRHHAPTAPLSTESASAARAAGPPPLAAGTPSHVPHDRVALVQRLADWIGHAQESGGELVVRVSAPGSRSAAHRSALRRGAITARLETQTDAAQHVLLEHLSQLNDALTQRGATVDRIDVVRAEPRDLPADSTADPRWTGARGKSGTRPSRAAPPSARH